MIEKASELEKGTMGLISWSNQRIPVDYWEINHTVKSAKAYCDLDGFKERYNLRLVEFRPVLGSDWLVRFDNEEHVYFGSTRCYRMSFPDPSDSSLPQQELLSGTRKYGNTGLFIHLKSLPSFRYCI